MVAYPIRFLVGLLWFGIGLFWAPFVIFGVLVRSLRKGPKGIISLFHRKDLQSPPAVKNPKFRHDFVRTRSGLKFHYVHSGSSGSPLMLCLHGFPECWYSYHYILDHFCEKYHVVAFDMRGYGDSDKPKAIGKYHMDYLMNDVKEIVDALGYQKAIFVCHDWGGVIGWQVPLYFPDIVDKLIVLNAPHHRGLEDFVRAYPSQFLKSWYAFMFQLPWLAEFHIRVNDYKMLKSMFGGRTYGIRSEERRLTEEELDIYKYSTGKNITHAINYYRAANPIYTGMGLRPKHKIIKQPVLLIFGKDDAALDYRMVPFMEKYCEDFTSHLIENCSHWVTLDRPDEVKKLMEDFLETKSARKANL